MAGKYSEYLEKKILDLVFGATAFTAPTTLYIGLSTSTITDDAAGITEPSGNAYTRVAVVNNTTNFPSSTSNTTQGSKTNGTAITFPTPTGSWGTVTYFFISDAASGGNIIAWGSLSASQSISSGNTVSFAVSALTITLA